MAKKYQFKQESTASKFAKILRDEYKKEAVSEGTSVTIKDECCEKEAVANCCSMDEVHCLVSDMYRNMYQEMDIMYRYISETREEMYEMLWEHKEGHLPNIKDAGKMEEVLRNLGLADSFEVRKPIISVASNGRGGLDLSVE